MAASAPGATPVIDGGTLQYTLGLSEAGTRGKPRWNGLYLRSLRNLPRRGEASPCGEHHRADFAISSPDVILAAIATRTKRILLASAVTVLSSDDPIRVFQRFSTLDAVSGGRAEVILGRGSFTESFPLFGYNLADYEALFDEKLDLFAAILKNDAVTWKGHTRPPLTNQRIFPPIENGTLKTWIGVGGSPQSVVRAAHYDPPLMLAIIGGDPNGFRPYVDLYHRAFA
jgi:alkanesulfonate monooxygenase SsuD/methylene tetrahydromethanopterin reductase-like flavin-dependent oxidoreductase (luciferase family)